MSAAIDWAGLMRRGIGPPPQGLGLRPREFWQLTPVELRMMLGEVQAAPPLTRGRLMELAAAFPDGQGVRDG